MEPFWSFTAFKICSFKINCFKAPTNNANWNIDAYNRYFSQCLADSESDEEMEPLYIPEIPNRILWLQYTNENSVWISMGGYDAGYIYEFQFDKALPMKCTAIKNATDTEITTYLYL